MLAKLLAKDTHYSNWLAKDLQEYLGKAHYNFYTIKDNNSMSSAGFLIYSHIFDEAEIIMIWIAPIMRKIGLANKLLGEMISNCRAINVSRINLEVAMDNLSAISLYKNHGFKEIGRRRAYYTRDNGETIDAIMMQYSA